MAGCGFDFVEGGRADEAVGDALVGLVHDGGADAVGPGATVEQAGRGEGAAAQLLGVEAERGLLRGVLAHGKGAWLGLGCELVAEAGGVLEIGHDDPLWRRCVFLGEACLTSQRGFAGHRSLTEKGSLVLVGD